MTVQGYLRSLLKNEIIKRNNNILKVCTNKRKQIGLNERKTENN